MKKYIINEETFNGLNNLLSRNKDAENGFVEVANNINYVNLTQWLIDWAKIHNEHALQLEQLINELGGTPDATTSLVGELHHAWIDLKAQWTNNNTAELLTECIRGQEKALKDYEEIIAVEVLPDFARVILNNQKEDIKTAVKDLKLLENAYEKLEDTSI